jgi:phosphopentomutase
VLDAVGAGELPDAAQYGDEGSDTLGNVARAVGGLDLPSLEALGLGNVEPLEGCPPQPGAPAVAGRLMERSKGKDTTTGHWEHMGIVTAQAFPTYPHGFPHDVIDPFMHKTGRGVLGNKAASGTEIIQERGRSTSGPGNGSSTPRPTPSSRSPRTRRPSHSRSSTQPVERPARSSPASMPSDA